MGARRYPGARADVLPSGTVTFLVTDIEGSTRLLRGLGTDHYSELLATHDRVLDLTVAACGGVIVDREGDGCLAAFSGAVSAVRAALETQQALLDQAWPGGEPPRVRMGIHTGEAVEREGRYVSVALHEARRVGDSAVGGQILLSWSTRALLEPVGQLPHGCAMLPLGRFRLRDLDRPVPLAAITHPSLPSAATPPRAVPAVPAAALRPRTHFVGRDEELRTLDSLLGLTRLLTLTGSGGTGKTRLAGELAGRVADTFADGVVAVELASVAEPASVARAVAQAVGVHEEPGRPVVDTVADAIAGRHSLLLLDNCEHVIDAVAALADALLDACPDVTVLATSREPLDVHGETVWPVPPLSLSAAESGDDTASGDAIALFVDRAGAADPSFSLTAANSAAVAHICQMLDGLPLALELAAARVRLMPTEQLAARLDQRFEVLAGGRRTSETRHQTLRALVDWSYDLLDGSEQSALRSLSVLAGPFDGAAAEGVVTCDAVPVDSVAGLVAQLVRKSLVVPTNGSRTRLLETVRAYGRVRLEEAGELAAARDRHLAWVTQAVRRRTGEDEAGWYARHLQLLPEMRAAFAWAQDGPRLAAGVGLVRAIGFGLQRDHLQSEAREWVSALLDGDPGDSSLRATERAALLAALTRLHWKLGDLTSAQDSAREALRLVEAIDESDAESAAGQKDFDDEAESPIRLMMSLSSIALHDDRLVEAEAICRQLLPKATSVYEEAGILHNLGMAYAGSGRAVEALEILDRALELARGAGLTELEMRCTSTRALALLESGRSAEAIPQLLDALALDVRHGDVDLATDAIADAARIALLLFGDAASALTLMTASLTLLRELNVTLPAFHRRIWYSCRDDARGALTLEAATDAEATGSQLTLTEAADLAHEVLSREVPATPVTQTLANTRRAPAAEPAS